LWIYLFPLVGCIELPHVLSVCKTMQKHIRHPDCWSSNSLKYYILKAPHSQGNSWTSIQHLCMSIPDSSMSLTFVQAISDLKNIRSLNCSALTFARIVYHTDRKIHITDLSISLVSLGEDEMNALDTWGLITPCVSRLIFSSTYVLSLESEHRICSMCKRFIQGMKYLSHLHHIEFNCFVHMAGTYEGLIHDLSRYASYLKTLYVLDCPPDDFHFILNDFPHLTYFEIPEDVLYVLSPFQWTQLLEENRFQWHGLHISVKRDIIQSTQFISSKEHMLAIALIHTCDIYTVPREILSSLFLLPLRKLVFQNECKFTFQYIDLSTVFKALPHVREFEFDPLYELDQFTLIVILKACFYLPLTLKKLTLPLSSFNMSKKRFNLVTFFDRFSSLEYLHIPRGIENSARIYYSQCYLTRMKQLKVLKFDCLHLLSYKDRRCVLQDIPSSLQKFHIPGFCIYTFSRIDNTCSVSDWWTSYILNLPHLRCMTLPLYIQVHKPETEKEYEEYPWERFFPKKKIQKEIIEIYDKVSQFQCKHGQDARFDPDNCTDLTSHSH
ncbi:MAG: hypothetical protein Sylvanvirus33_1, partial [Sylvanvirus sp.]